jgi:hypothetical protein
MFGGAKKVNALRASAVFIPGIIAIKFFTNVHGYPLAAVLIFYN